MEIKGSRVLVTGGSDGIGLAIGRALAERGARVALMARNRDRLEKAARDIGALALPGDVSNEKDANETVAAVVREFGGIDVLVNNAGIGYFAPLADMDTARFRKVFDVNVTGAMFMARAAVPHFLSAKSGNIVNISSTSGLKGGSRSTAYSASKFALRGMTECWRDELRRHDIRVMLINPSEVMTRFAENAGFTQQESEKKLRGVEIADAVVSVLSMDSRGFIPELAVFATNPF